MLPERTPKWPAFVLRAAAVYNIAWGIWVIAFPNHLFEFSGIDLPNYPGIWQCVGMIVGVYGIGYWLAARDYVRHWPIVVVGLIGKILGPIGFLHSAITGLLPWSWGVTLLTNDLIWWLPFAGILYLVAKHQSDPLNQSAMHQAIREAAASRTPDQSLEQISRHTLVSDGTNLWELGLH